LRLEPGPRFTFAINSALAFATAELLTAALHETGHALAARVLGFAPRIYAFYENNPHGTTLQDIVVLAAGPVASLLFGVLFLALFRKTSRYYSYGRLLLLWLGWLGVMEFVNYLIVTPWLAAGDTAQIANRLGWPELPRYAVAALGIVAVFFLGRPAAVAMCAVAPANVALGAALERRRYLFLGFYLPLIAGTLLTALAGIGSRADIVFLGLFGTFGNIDLVGAAMLFVRAPIEFRERAIDAPLRVEPAALVLFALVSLWYITALSRGVAV